jgi:hypothetical protein
MGLLVACELTVVSGVSGFLGSLAVLPAGTWDGKHLLAALVAAGVATAYKLSGVLQNYVQSQQASQPSQVTTVVKDDDKSLP